MQTTIVKVYLDTTPAVSVPIGEADELSARRKSIDHIRKDLDSYTVATYRMHVINRRQYLFIFLEPIRTDFSTIVNNIFKGVCN